MRAEGHAALGQLAQLRQGHDLEAAGIGQDRVWPAGKLVQAAQPRDALGAGPQHKMVGVAQNDIGAEVAGPDPGYIALTVPPVPTGMKAGVRTTPRGIEISPRRAEPSSTSG